MPSLAGLRPEFREAVDYLLRVAQYNGLRVQITSTLRTRAQQTTLYERYLRCRGIGGRGACLPAAPPGTSDHELGLAIDLVVDGDYRGARQRALGEFWETMGGRWAGEVDPVHFSV